jgi:hypothetical protein
MPGIGAKPLTLVAEYRIYMIGSLGHLRYLALF